MNINLQLTPINYLLHRNLYFKLGFSIKNQDKKVTIIITKNKIIYDSMSFFNKSF